jgi:hypothetical protein
MDSCRLINLMERLKRLERDEWRSEEGNIPIEHNYDLRWFYEDISGFVKVI